MSDLTNSDGSTYQATATIAIADMAKVGGRTMTAADIITGSAPVQTNFIKATFQFHDNAAPVDPNALSLNGDRWHLPDFSADVEIRQISASLNPSDNLTPADQANGITYRGSAELKFISRYTQNGKVTAYKDDRALFGILVQNGTAQVALADDGRHLSRTRLTAASIYFRGTEIDYPAEVFRGVEDCEAVGATACS